MALTDKLTAVADAIRTKSGKTGGLTLAQMPTEIANIKTGVELAFEVVPNPQPSSPKENTIWVDTTTINGWAFSATAPESPKANMVWIATGLSSPAEFNVLAEGNVTVYPISAKQYVGGEWVSVTAKSYQNRAWVEWIQYLYNADNEYTDITGGWEKKNKLSSSTATGSMTKNSDHVYLKNVQSATVGMVTVNQIDLTPYTQMHCLCKCSGEMTFCAAPSFPTSSSSYLANGKFDAPNNEVVSVDISGVNTIAKIGVFENETKGTYVYKVWLE